MPNIKVVIGANYGDEGKGLMTDYFAHQAKQRNESCVVVMSNGGSQRGHTVSTPEGLRHVFHHFGSGTLAGADTYCCKEFILNPMNFVKEWNELTALGVKPHVFVHADCRWTTPFDMILNQILEECRGDQRHGSCGQGIWETVKRCEEDYIPSLVSCQMTPDYWWKFVRTYLNKQVIYLPSRVHEAGIEDIPPVWKPIIQNQELIEHYIRDFQFMMEHVHIVEDDDYLKIYKNIIFENGQGLLLDDKYGDHATPSNTGLQNATEMIRRIFPKETVEVCYVTRTYMTRHGAGPMDYECDKSEINLDIFDETNQPNPWQGSLRYGKIQPKDFLFQIAADLRGMKNYSPSLAITHLNETNRHMVLVPHVLTEETIKGWFEKVYESDGMTRESVKEREKLW